ncbi:hypothetical protein C1H76_9064 [Elsinoe australis]|uniref:Uncharacterized protein n=1 Tax=Elsinoe australis TaxID=40998 RepID=A0A4U7ALB6_9PEZI|nr:hypothetical protein C1H76_9064 [Elsinoe australis]
MSILIGSAFLTMLSLTLLLSCSSSGGPSLTESTSHQHQHQRQYGTAPDAIIEGMPSSSTSHALLPLPTTRSKDASSTADSAKSPSPESISFKHVSQVVNSPEVSIQHEVKPIDQLTFVLPCEECSENSGVPYPYFSVDLLGAANSCWANLSINGTIAEIRSTDHKQCISSAYDKDPDFAFGVSTWCYDDTSEYGVLFEFYITLQLTGYAHWRIANGPSIQFSIGLYRDDEGNTAMIRRFGFQVELSMEVAEYGYSATAKSLLGRNVTQAQAMKLRARAEAIRKELKPEHTWPAPWLPSMRPSTC